MDPQHLLGDRFRIDGLLGKGGMGTVYRAHDPALGRDVALKVVSTSGQTETRLERFRREGEITASLSHPGIVKVYSSGVVAGTPFLAYELVPGARDLAEVFAECDLRGRVELLRDAARALGFAHAQGVVHRDVKPGNVLVDAAGRARVADFGLAAAQGQERLTQTGALVGTPYYMAPELVSGGKQVGPPADVWALGVILYEACTGRVPFEGETFFELARRITDAELLSPRQVDPTTPRPLEAICLKALQAAPALRYPDGEALAADLDAFLEDRPITASSSTLGRFAAPALRRAKLPVALAVLGVAAVGLAVWVATRPISRAVAESSPEGRQASARETSAQASSERLTKLAELPPHQAYPGLLSWLRETPRHPRAKDARALLEKLRTAPLVRLRQGGRHVRALFVGPDLVLSYGVDRTLCWWNWRSGEQLKRWKTSVSVLTAVLAPPRTLFLGSRGLFRVRGVGAEQPFAVSERLLVRRSSVVAVAVSPDGKTVLGGGTGNGIKLLEVDGEGEPGIGRFAPFRSPCRALAFSADGARLYTVSGYRVGKGKSYPALFRVWDVSTQKVLARITVPPMGECVAASSSGLVAVGFSMGRLLLFDRDGNQVGELIDPTHDDSKWDVAVRKTRLAHGATIRALAFSRDGRYLYSAAGYPSMQGDKSELAMWSVRGRKLIRGTRASGHAFISMQLSVDERYLLLGTRQGEVQVWANPPLD